MRSEWPQVRIAECCDLIVDCVNKTAPVVDYKTPYRMIRTTNVRGGFIDLQDCKFVTEDTFRTWTRRAAVLDGDVILTREAPIGEVGLVRGNQTIFLGQRLMQYRARRSILDPRFLCYAFLSPQLRHQFGAHEGSGSVVSHIRVGDCSNFRVPVPPLSKQVEIADLLGAIDERRLLLRETNATLESIVQALFKSWFIDFDPVRAKAEGREPEGIDAATAALFPAEFEDSALGLIPKGWECRPIGDLVEAVGGSTPDTKTAAYWDPPTHCWTSPKDLSGATAPVLLDTERKVSDAGLAKISSGLLPPGTLLMSSRAPIGYLSVAQVPMAINQGYIAMLPGGCLPPLYLYFWCQANMDAIKGRANGSTFMEISKRAFRPIPAIAPPSRVVQHFTDLAATLFARLVENERQARSLAEVRGALLPRLISGKLRLPEAEEQVEAALA